MAFLNNINQVRQVEWSRGYLWDIRLEGAPSPFDTWFPAVDVEETLATAESQVISVFNRTIKFPDKQTVRSVRVTFVDDVENTLARFLRDWVNITIFNRGQGVTALKNCAKRLIIQRLSTSNEAAPETSTEDSRVRPELAGQTSIYWVYPEGSIIFTGNSSGDPRTYPVEFVVVGESQNSTSTENNTAASTSTVSSERIA